MHTVGRRTWDGRALADQGALARTATALRGTTALVPRGVYRFHSFEEADTWMTDMISRTRARLNRTTSSAFAGR